MAASSIEWTDLTLNPGIYGCHEVSPACAHCYAAKMAKRLVEMGKPGYVDHPEIVTRRPSGWHWSGEVRTSAERIPAAFAGLPKGLKRLESGSRPWRCFVTSMADVFHQDVPGEFIEAVFREMASRPHIQFQLLTKRTSRMRDWALARSQSWPANVWAGTTVENQEEARRRVPALVEVPAGIRFLSCEPLLGELELTEWLCEGLIHWVIGGGESGHRARPSDPLWFRKLRDDCARSEVPFHFKQWGEYAPSADDSLGVVKLGKKTAGRELDGAFHDGFPASMVE